MTMPAAVPRSTAAKRAVATIGAGLLNLMFFTFGFLMSTRVLYAGHSRPHLMCAHFLLLGMVSRLWSSRWWTVTVPAGAGYVLALGAFKWAVHLAETRGVYAPPVLQYVFGPSRSDVLWALAAAAAAGIGWWLAGRPWTPAGRRAPHG